jgi:hypothetical protein
MNKRPIFSALVLVGCLQVAHVAHGGKPQPNKAKTAPAPPNDVAQAQKVPADPAPPRETLVLLDQANAVIDMSRLMSAVYQPGAPGEGEKATLKLTLETRGGVSVVEVSLTGGGASDAWNKLKALVPAIGKPTPTP